MIGEERAVRGKLVRPFAGMTRIRF